MYIYQALYTLQIYTVENGTQWKSVFRNRAYNTTKSFPKCIEIIVLQVQLFHGTWGNFLLYCILITVFHCVLFPLYIFTVYKKVALKTRDSFIDPCIVYIHVVVCIWNKYLVIRTHKCSTLRYSCIVTVISKTPWEHCSYVIIIYEIIPTVWKNRDRK